ncbi:NUDIX hydrolase [Alkalicoccus urumqiensis]|uniref:ADP-ribose pyrophosphatase n=1 Tax=Alkalicoccus urumqiensis TaxID=1548213 RepID=A0A2P6MKH6_ALKUR|nr:NUDIX hydrolase [Alkalicoccus urumqiensis]PRO66761.1 ADP-ribose pyrophosphatase [Alkalicoccus urumqiensis]
MSSMEEKTIQSTPIFNGSVIRVHEDEVTLPNGKTSRRELVKHPGAVAVICVTEEGKLVLVKQYRKALEKAIAEIPAGKLEAGEEPAVCAARELEEETGIRASKMRPLGSFYTSPGFADELVYLFLAEGLSQGTVEADEDEFVERMDVTPGEAAEMVLRQEIHDAKTMYALLLWETKLRTSTT